MHIISWIFSAIVFSLGLLNLFLVHPVPGIIYLLVSLVFLPATNRFLWENTGFSIPFAVKIILFLIIIWFTMGISDLGEMAGL